MVNAFDAIAKGLQVRQQFDEQVQQNALRGLVQQQGPALMQGDPQALNALARLNPQAAMQMRQSATAWKEEAAKRLVQMIANAPDKAGAYQRARQYAGQIGLDVSAFPEQWGPDVERQVEVMSRLYAMPQQERTEFERLLQGLPEEMRGQAVLTRLGLAPRATAPTDVDRYGFEVPKGYRIGPDGRSVELIPGYVPRGGQEFTFTDPNGNTVRVGPAGGAGPDAMAKPTLNRLEGEIMDGQARMSRLTGIEDQFLQNPDLERIFTYGGQIDDALLKQMEKLSPSLLSDGERQRLGDNAQFRKAILDNLNRTIKEITGAAMTIEEAGRIGATEINADDSPTQARRKLQDAIRAQRAGLARLHMLRQQGLIDQSMMKPEALERLMSIEDVNRQIEAAQAQARKMSETLRDRLAGQVKAGQITEDQARAAMREHAWAVSQEFLRRFGI